jgi:hypothetical protein
LLLTLHTLQQRVQLRRGQQYTRIVLPHYTLTLHTHLTHLQPKVSRSKVVSSIFIDDIFYVVIVFKIHEIIYLRKGQYITGDIL